MHGLRNVLRLGHDPHASKVSPRYHGNSSLVYRVFRGLLHGWTSLVWLGMCLGIAAITVGLWAAPVLAIFCAFVLSAVTSLGSLLGGVRTARAVFTQTIVRVAVLAVLIHVFL